VTLVGEHCRGRTSDLTSGGYYIPYQSDAPVRVSALYNDIRPLGSPPLVWYHKLTLHAEPRTAELVDALRPIGELVLYMNYRLGTPDSEFVRCVAPSNVDTSSPHTKPRSLSSSRPAGGAHRFTLRCSLPFRVTRRGRSCPLTRTLS
jgi:hypothetical protein